MSGVHDNLDHPVLTFAEHLAGPGCIVERCPVGDELRRPDPHFLDEVQQELVVFFQEVLS